MQSKFHLFKKIIQQVLSTRIHCVKCTNIEALQVDVSKISVAQELDIWDEKIKPYIMALH